MEINKCRICGHDNKSELYVLREMMFGTREKFEYFKCEGCGCLQIKNFPENIQKYYPPDYFKFPSQTRSGIKGYLFNKREQYLYRRNSILGKLLALTFGVPENDLWLSKLKLKIDDFILEVGCGKGDLLNKFKDAGYKNLIGVDPYIERDIDYGPNLKIFKKNIFQLENPKFDLIMFHHSFEHLNNPHETFIKLTELVKQTGIVLIRIPLIDSYAWEYYRTDWVQLDPPRHFFLHSVKSLNYLANQHDFIISKIIYDSTAFQFIGSEQYKSNIPLMGSSSFFRGSRNQMFSEEIVGLYQSKAKQLNKVKKGDTASFFLIKKS
jgi:SAM-dependent methyltransferase